MFTQSNSRKEGESVIEKGSESLLLKAQPLEQAERICNSMVEVCVVDGDALLLAADPVWAEAINTVLVEKGVKVASCVRVPRSGVRGRDHHTGRQWRDASNLPGGRSGRALRAAKKDA